MPKTALITGAARRIGATIARSLHAAGYRVAIHYHESAEEADTLARHLNESKPATAITCDGDLADPHTPARLIDKISMQWGRLDALINNASVYHPTPVESTDIGAWDAVMAVNLRAPFFMCQAAAPLLKQHCGSIVNITDIYGERPQTRHPVYCASKAGLICLTRALARDLAPEIRVNAVSPGAVLWPVNDDPTTREEILRKTPLSRSGAPADIAKAVCYLLDAEFVTGQILAVDGGRMLQI